MLVHRKNLKNDQQSKLKKSSMAKIKQTAHHKKKEVGQCLKNTMYYENTVGGIVDRKDFSFNPHIASSSELIYTPFRKDYYLPPHLNSGQVHRTIFGAECPNWQIRSSSTKKYDYDQLYSNYESKYQRIKPSRRWSCAKSKIKSLIDEDRATEEYFRKPHELTNFEREKHPDDDLSEESSNDAQ